MIFTQLYFLYNYNIYGFRSIIIRGTAIPSQVEWFGLSRVITISQKTNIKHLNCSFSLLGIGLNIYTFKTNEKKYSI